MENGPVRGLSWDFLPSGTIPTQGKMSARNSQMTLLYLLAWTPECPLVPGFRKCYAARQSLHVVVWNSAFGSVSLLQLQSSGFFVVVVLFMAL